MNQAPALFPLGREALLWLRDGGRPARAGYPWHLLVRWQAWWFERNLALQRRLRRRHGALPDPLFVLGFWRCGTTYMHELLATCPRLRAPATWQCMAPSTFLLTGAPAERVVQRPMDGLAIDSYSPQEDEFALLALGVPSVYRGFFDPRRLPELVHWLDPAQWRMNRPGNWLETWRGFLADVRGDAPERLVVKSPTHSFRIQAIAEAFPDLELVWLVRDPQQTLHSARKMWLAMFERYALWNWDAAMLDDFIARALLHLATALDWLRLTLPRERAAVIDFESLTTSPAAVVRSLNERFELAEWSEWVDRVQALAASRSDYRQEEYPPLPMSAHWAAVLERVGAAQDAAQRSHGL